uniref:hypothetical protein n=1 Tax=Oceanispirochaeta sp. TaxID=2035350 RepID=UPI00263A0981
LRYYWQPPHVLTDQACLNSLEDLVDKLTNLHVFQWRLTGFRDPDRRIERRPLEEGAERWRRFIKAADRGGDRYAYLEFVRGDDPGQLRADWTTFKSVLSRLL